MTLTRRAGLRIRTLLGNASPLLLLEKQYISGQSENGFPPVFIIGPPRTGSTLLYQLLAHYYHCSYFTNFASVFYGAPSLTSRLTSPFYRKYTEVEFRSDHGLINGWWAPSEAGAVHRSWFPREEYESVDSVRIRKTCYSIAKTMGGPFVWKNLNNSFVLNILHEVFPSALFVKIDRDPAFTCQSIYITVVKKKAGNIEGLHPKDLSNSENLIEDLVARVLEIDRATKAFLATSGCNGLVVNYQDLCLEHAAQLTLFEEAYQDTGYVIKKKRDFANLDLVPSEKIKVSAEEWRAIQVALNKADIGREPA